LLRAIAAAVGLGIYLSGRRYISSDNAYAPRCLTLGVQNVLITPDISSKIERFVVHERQHVAAGEVPFEIDPEPFKLTLAQAKAKLAGVRVELANLKANMRSLTTPAELSQRNVGLKQRDVDRPTWDRRLRAKFIGWIDSAADPAGAR
jgi:membrane fusion protein, multidrug efflux system